MKLNILDPEFPIRKLFYIVLELALLFMTAMFYGANAYIESMICVLVLVGTAIGLYEWAWD
jgi:hypothetical protein